MPSTAQLDPDFVFRPIPPLTGQAPAENQLGPLAALAGTWNGAGFSAIWRPHFPDAPQDRFLELNLTTDALSFSPIPGPIPNRGLLQHDIAMFGLTYLQQVADSTTGGGLHIEPGIWAVVPETTDPPEQSTVVRMASIPHGTAMIAQGIASSAPGPPTILATSIVPFGIDDDERPGFVAGEINFPELILTRPTQFRVTAPGITTAMLMNPNSILTDLNATQTIRSTTTLHVTTTPLPVPGGGTVNTAFLGAGNAIASSVDATFWIESVEDADGGPDTLQLQYSQTVMLDFKKLRWPHVIVGTLQREG